MSDKFVIKTVRILCQSLHFYQTCPWYIIGFADGSEAACPDLAVAVSAALKDCPLLTARYTSLEVYNSVKQSLSLKQLEARMHLGRTQVCQRLAKERITFIKQFTLLDVMSIAQGVRHSETQQVSSIDHLYDFPRRHLMKVPA